MTSLKDLMKNAANDALINHIKVELKLKRCTQIKIDYTNGLNVTFVYYGLNCKIVFSGNKCQFYLYIDNMFDCETCLSIESMFKKINKQLK